MGREFVKFTTDGRRICRRSLANDCYRAHLDYETSADPIVQRTAEMVNEIFDRVNEEDTVPGRELAILAYVDQEGDGQLFLDFVWES